MYSQTEIFKIIPIGYVRKEDGKTYLEILKSFVPALKELEHFSHVRVCWWFHRFQDDRFRRATQSAPPYENAPRTGVFASRSPVRPNPIGLTTVKIIDVDQDKGIIEVASIDAYDETPIIDLKPYIPSCDRIKGFSVPEWIAHWPEWMPETDIVGLGPEGGDEGGYIVAQGTPEEVVQVKESYTGQFLRQVL